MYQRIKTSPLGFLYGLHCLVRAIVWLFSHPLSLLLLLIPGIVGIFLTLGSLFWMVSEWRLLEQLWSQYLWSRPTEGYWLLVYYPSFLFAVFGLIFTVALSLVVAFKIMLLPLYDQLSGKVEKEMLQDQAVELGFLASLRALGGELRVALLLLALSLLTFIPFLGLVALPLAAFVSGFDACNYCLARRSWSLKQRIQFASSHFWACLAIGIPLTIPLVSIMMAPIVVVGGTLFTCEQLRIAGFDKSSRKLGEEKA